MSVQESESTYAREEEELPSVLPQSYDLAVFAGSPSDTAPRIFV